MGKKRPTPRERVDRLIRALNEEPQTIKELSLATKMKWITVWEYLRLIKFAQSCPKVVPVREGKRLELWRREWGKLPE